MKRAKRLTALPFTSHSKAQGAAATARIISSEVPPASPLLRDGTFDHMFERMYAAELFQGPVVLTFSIARDGLDLGFETPGCAAGRARAFSEEGVKSTATNAQRRTSVPQSYVGVLWSPKRLGW